MNRPLTAISEKSPTFQMHTLLTGDMDDGIALLFAAVDNWWLLRRFV